MECVEWCQSGGKESECIRLGIILSRAEDWVTARTRDVEMGQRVVCPYVASAVATCCMYRVSRKWWKRNVSRMV